MKTAYLCYAPNGATIKEVNNPIAWLFRNDRKVSSFLVKALDHGEGYLCARLNDNTEFIMFWSDYYIMMSSILTSRAWKNHFSGINIYKSCYSANLGWYTKTWTIG